jgi:polyphosphate glucokinase
MAPPGVTARRRSRRPKVLVIDVGGTHVKALATGHRTSREIRSGASMTARAMVKQIRRLTADWRYDVVSIGYPGVVVHGRPVAEPHHLARGWVGFDFRRAFGRPVRVVNDAAMQALGSYRRGRMLFLGLGTGLGSAMIIDGVLEPMELAHLPYRKGRTYEEYLGARALRRLGEKRWRRHVREVVTLLRTALGAGDVVVGGGNAHRLKDRLPGVRIVDNANAFVGGFRLWDERPRQRSRTRRAPGTIG